MNSIIDEKRESSTGDIENTKKKKKANIKNQTTRTKNYNVWGKKNTLNGLDSRLNIVEESLVALKT